MLTRLMDAASRTMPGATGRLAAIAMLVPGRRMRVRPEQREVMDRARREVLQVGRHRLRVYRWGSGERSMLLVHGWQGRAAQFAELVARFEGEATIVAFDAPAHGESRGVRADIGMWIQAIRALDARFDFDVLVAHSFGGLAALRARLAGLVRATVVSISAPPSTDAVMGAYARQVGLTDAVASAVNAALARRLGPVMASIAMGSRVRSPDPVERARTGTGNPGIFVVGAGSGEPAQLTHDLDAWPVFTDNGATISFARDATSENADDESADPVELLDEDTYELWTVPASGGAETFVHEGDYETLAVRQADAPAAEPVVVTVTRKGFRYTVRWTGTASAWKVTLAVGRKSVGAAFKGSVHSATFVLRATGKPVAHVVAR